MPADLVAISPLNLKRDENIEEGSQGRTRSQHCQECLEDIVVTLNRAKGTRSMDPASSLWFGES